MAEEKNEKITCDFILNWFKEAVEKKEPIPPSVWLDGASKLNVLQGDEEDILFELQQKVAEIRVKCMEESDKINVSRAKVLVEATDEYKQMKKQAAKVARIQEQIRISKIQARMRDNEYGGQ